MSRTTETTKLKIEMSDLLKQRQSLAAQLGASLYEITRDNPAMTEGREALYSGIAQLDEKRAKLEEQIAEIEALAVAAQKAATNLKCPRCGASVPMSDMFCSGCGLPIAEVRAA